LDRRYLVDASSLIKALKLKAINILADNYIQELTIYEVLNAIWKEAYLVKSITIGEAQDLIKIFAEMLEYLEILSIHPYEVDALIKAIELGLTIYDASYVILAEKYNLILVTEDEKLREKASEIVNVLGLNELIK